MSKLIVIVGNAGIGKTTLARALCESGSFATGLEGLGERPFHTKLSGDPRYALANQIDFLLYRAEQERFLRSAELGGLQDGGLEMDFHVFTKLFRKKGLLGPEEFSLCERVYFQIRTTQPPPEAIVHMQAPLEVIAERFTRRRRPVEITEREDLSAIENLMDEWLSQVDPRRLLQLDVSGNDPSYRKLLPQVLDFISSH